MTFLKDANGTAGLTFATLNDSLDELDAVQVNVGRSVAPLADVDLSGGSDSSAALQARIDLLPVRGGNLVFPLNAYVKHSTTLDLTAKDSVRFVGSGGRYAGADPGPPGQTKLEYTGTTMGINAQSVLGFQMESLYYSGFSLGATGILICLDKSGSPDTSQASITDCWLRGTNNGTGILVSLANAHSTRFSGTIFHGGSRAIRGKTIAGDFSNSITIEGRCFFQYSAAAPILNPGQAWSIHDCVFEPIQSSSGPAGAVEVAATFAVDEQFSYRDNSHQDATTSGDWLTLRGQGFDISGNFFNTGARFIVFAGAVDGVSVTGNTFWGANTAAVDGGSTGVTNFHEAGNRWRNNTLDLTGKINVDRLGFIAKQTPTNQIIASAWPAADRGLFLRYVPEVTHTAAGVAFVVGTLDAGNPTVDVAICDDAATPNRLASSGSTAGKLNATGVQSVSFTSSIVLRRGKAYYVGLSTPSTTVQLYMVDCPTGTLEEILGTASNTGLFQGVRNTVTPIPNPLPGGLASVARVPHLALKTA